MITKLHLVVLGGVPGLFLIGLALLSAVATDQARFDDRRAGVLSQYQETVQQRAAHLMEPERTAPVGREAGGAPWTAHLERVEAALAQRNVSAAELAWQAAYGEALRSRRWEGMLEVGEASLRIGEVAGTRKLAEAKARQAYLTALFRARQQESLDGVLRTAEAFAALGDREVAEQGVYVAQRLAAARAQDAQARERVRVVAERLSARLIGPESSEFGEF